MAKKVVLAYSGGLDTSVIIRWLIDRYQCEVIAVAADLGQGEDLSKLKDKGRATGACDVHILDLTEEFLNGYCLKALAAEAVYERDYFLATALGRPLIARKMVEIARESGADAVAHGCTGKGNDQVRFDVSFMALNPDLKIIAPVRDWEFGSREEEMEYAELHDIPVEATREKPYSIDRNIWGISIECGVLEDPWTEPPADVYQITRPVERTPDNPLYLEIEFAGGRPVALDGETLPVIDLVKKLNELGGAYGIGRSDLVENRWVGIKSREIYEAPAAFLLHAAHRALGGLVFDRHTLSFNRIMSQKYSELVYNALWFSPLRKALDDYFENLQQVVTGTVRLKLHKGTATVAGRKSPCSLYEKSLATYDKEDRFDHKTGEAFGQIWGMAPMIAGIRDRKPFGK
ncbi:MAG: argininosuccinate synthase [bacterium]